MASGRVFLRVWSENEPLRRMTRGEAVSALWGVALKMEREGYVGRRMRVLETEGGDYLGRASVEGFGGRWW